MSVLIWGNLAGPRQETQQRRCLVVMIMVGAAVATSSAAVTAIGGRHGVLLAFKRTTGGTMLLLFTSDWRRSKEGGLWSLEGGGVGAGMREEGRGSSYSVYPFNPVYSEMQKKEAPPKKMLAPQMETPKLITSSSFKVNLQDNEQILLPAPLC